MRINEKWAQYQQNSLLHMSIKSTGWNFVFQFSGAEKDSVSVTKEKKSSKLH